MKLEVYKKKRDFDKSPEPEGKVLKEKKKAQKIFCVQYHCATRNHYDFRLEWDGVLLSWAVPKGPSFNTKDKRLAVMVEDHPIDYADFEGVIGEGQYGAGPVMLWDEGTWEPLTDVNKGLKEGSLKFSLYGKRLKGRWALVRLKDESEKDKKHWLLIKENDEYSQKEDGISDFNTSIKTGRTVEEILKREDLRNRTNPFSSVEVQLASLVNKLPDSKNFLYEIKYDGYRIVAFIEGGKARLFSRNGKDYTKKFPYIVKSLEKMSLGRAMVFDGEIIATDENGKSDFQKLQNHLKNKTAEGIVYMIFDILAMDGEDLRENKLIERKEILSSIMKDAPYNLIYSQHIEGNGKECFDLAKKLGLEGIVGKRLDSEYIGKRSNDWIKLKCYKRQEFIIIGYTRSEKKDTGISALILGAYKNNKLIYVGRAGTGLNQKDMEELEDLFKDIKTSKPAVLAAKEKNKDEEIFWLEPEYVAEIQFAEWTEEKQLRQGSYKGLRDDKSAREVIIEEDEEIVLTKKSKTKSDEIEVLGVKISNPGKLVYTKKKITKLDIVNYYQKVSERMLPYLSNRVLSVVRCHKGITGECFFKKHPITKSKGISTIDIENTENEKKEYFYITDSSGVISEVQLGTIEFHIWGSKVTDLEKPDMMVFDLDPDEGMGLDQIRQGVKDLKSILDNLSLKSYLKTSGGKGYHVVVPFFISLSWEDFNDFAKSVAKLMEQKWPDKYTSNIRKIKRKGKIFIDWARNGRGSTSVAPYSLRARVGAHVSMPITWKELDTVAPNEIDINEAIKRIAKPDPWKSFYENDK